MASKKPFKKELTAEEYFKYKNYWKDGEWVIMVPKGRKLIMTSDGRYYLVEKEIADLFK